MTGLDNRALLPPYFPLFRNEDLLFGMALQFLHPDSLMLDFPWALPHIPMKERRWDTSDLDRAASFSFQTFSWYHISRASSNHLSADTEMRLQALGRYFLDLAETDNRTLLDLFDDLTLDMRTKQIGKYHQTLVDTGGKPDYWAQDIRTLLAANEKGLMETRGPVFTDFPQPMGAEQERLDYARNLWRSFGNGISGWGKIREAAILARQFSARQR